MDDRSRRANLTTIRSRCGWLGYCEKRTKYDVGGERKAIERYGWKGSWLRMKLKKNLLQIVAWALCIMHAIGLVIMVQVDRKRSRERIQEMQRQAIEAEAINSEKQETMKNLYDQFYSQWEMNSFVCWGDSAMVGNKNSSLPVAFRSVTEKNLFAPLSRTFSKVLESEEYNTPSIDITNMGILNEGMRQILVRAGVNTLKVGDMIMISEDTNPVTVKLVDDEAWNSGNANDELRFARQKTVTFGKVWISDIEGALIETDDWFDSNHPRYAFARDKKGSSQSVGAGTDIEIESATKYIGDVPIFFFENNAGRSADGFVSDVENLVLRYADLDDKKSGVDNNSGNSYDLPFVVICTTDAGSDVDKAMYEAFGNRYIRNESSSGEMNEQVYRKLAQEVYENLAAQGCFDEAKEKIAEIVKEAEGK